MSESEAHNNAKLRKTIDIGWSWLVRDVVENDAGRLRAAVVIV
jgi:hypothetical protein